MEEILITGANIVNEAGSLKAVSWSGATGSKRLFLQDQPVPSGRLDNIDWSTGVENSCFPGVIDDQVHFRDPGLTAKVTLALNPGRQSPVVSPHSGYANTIPEPPPSGSSKKNSNLLHKSPLPIILFSWRHQWKPGRDQKSGPAKICGVKFFGRIDRKYARGWPGQSGEDLCKFQDDCRHTQRGWKDHPEKSCRLQGKIRGPDPGRGTSPDPERRSLLYLHEMGRGTCRQTQYPPPCTSSFHCKRTGTVPEWYSFKRKADHSRGMCSSSVVRRPWLCPARFPN